MMPQVTLLPIGVALALVWFAAVPIARAQTVTAAFVPGATNPQFVTLNDTDTFEGGGALAGTPLFLQFNLQVNTGSVTLTGSPDFVTLTPTGNCTTQVITQPTSPLTTTASQLVISITALTGLFSVDVSMPHSGAGSPFTFTVNGHAGSLRVGYFTSDGASVWPVEQRHVWHYLTDTRMFAQVTVWNINNGFDGTPTLGDLQAHDAIYVSNNNATYDRPATGDALADYIDAGGGVLLTSVSGMTAFGPQGRLLSGNYFPIAQAANNTSVIDTLGTVHQPTHPIMAGVTAIESRALYQRVGTPGPSATRIFDWNGGGGVACAVIDGVFNGRVAAFDVWQLSDLAPPVGTVGWLDAPSNNRRLIVNILEWIAQTVAGPRIEVRDSTSAPVPVGGTLSVGNAFTGLPNTISIAVANTGSQPLTISGVNTSNPVNCTVSGVVPGAPIPANTVGSVDLIVTPGITAAFSFDVSIDSSDPIAARNPYTISADGTAVDAPAIGLQFPPGTPVANGASINIGARTANQASTALFTITNAGPGTLTLATTTAQLPSNCTAAVTTPPALTTLTTGQSTTFEITFTPGIGVFSFNVVVTSDDPLNGTYTLTINGTAPSLSSSSGGGCTTSMGAWSTTNATDATTATATVILVLMALAGLIATRRHAS